MKNIYIFKKLERNVYMLPMLKARSKTKGNDMKTRYFQVFL